MRIGSLFSGIGGLELGLEWAGVGHTVWQVELDPKCRQELAIHWPDALRFADVREVGAHNLPPVDVLCGGFPCQDISYAGKGAGLAGARSGLWYEFARIVGELGPRYVVVENVRALLTRGIDAVLGTLADLGFDAEWSVVSAAAVGAPHRRERVFILAYRDDGRCEQHHAGQWSVSQPGPRDTALGDSHRDGTQREGGAQFGVEAGCDGVGDANGDRERQPSGTVTDERRWVANGGQVLGDAERQRGRGRRVGEHATNARSPGQMVGWADTIHVRGHDGTVRAIPADAGRGPESPLYPVAYGVSGRVARLRALGNAVVPQCAYVVGRRLVMRGAT